MRKSTFYGLAALCGLGSLPAGLVIDEVFFAGKRSIPKSAMVEQDFLSLQNSIKVYKINVGRPPTTAQGFDALVNKPKSAPKPKRWVQIMKEVPTDPWGTQYRYTLLRPKEYEWRWEVRSAGADRIFGSSDDQASEDDLGKLIQSIAEQPEAGSDSRPSF